MSSTISQLDGLNISFMEQLLVLSLVKDGSSWDLLTVSPCKNCSHQWVNVHGPAVNGDSWRLLRLPMLYMVVPFSWAIDWLSRLSVTTTTQIWDLCLSITKSLWLFSEDSPQLVLLVAHQLCSLRALYSLSSLWAQCYGGWSFRACTLALWANLLMCSTRMTAHQKRLSVSPTRIRLSNWLTLWAPTLATASSIKMWDTCDRLEDLFNNFKTFI